MKRIFYCLYLLSALRVYGFDFGVDFTKLDPKIFVSNMNNEYRDGYIISNSQVIYYRKPILFSIICNKDNIDNFYIYYSFNPEDKELFIRFFNEYFNHYAAQSVRLVVKSSNTAYGNEMHYEIGIPGLPPYIIYVHNSNTTGILGFGMTYSSGHNSKFDGDVKSVASLWDNPRTINYMYKFRLNELRSNICYYKDLEFLENVALVIDKDRIDGWDDYYYSFDASIVKKKRNASMFTIRLSVTDEELKNDFKFLSYFIRIDSEMIISFYDLMKEGVYKVYGSDYSRFRIDMSTSSKEEMIKLSEKFKVIISSE